MSIRVIAMAAYDHFIGDIINKKTCFVCYREVPRGWTILLGGESVCNVPSEVRVRKEQMKLDTPTYRREM